MKKFLTSVAAAGTLLMPTLSAEHIAYIGPKKEIEMKLPQGDLAYHMWDFAVPEEKRRDTAFAAINRSLWAVRDTDNWARIGQSEWKSLYPPVRAATAKNMVRHWSQHYNAGEKAGIPKNVFDETFTAMIIGESEFERFFSEGGDLGLTMVSAWTRPRLREMYMEGRADFNFKDSDYFYPNNAIRAGVFWFNYLLEEEIAKRPAKNSLEAERYLNTAIGAYNDGAGKATNRSPKSMAYRKRVEGIMRECRKSYDTVCLALNDSPYHRQ